MIAMQYGFVLPADFDMAIIRRRIADKGHLLDGYPGLGFKAYLFAVRDDPELPSRENLYAPFYLWQEGAGMNTFLASDGFAALALASGRPAVRTRAVWHAETTTADLSLAACATRELAPIPPEMPVAACRAAEAEAVRADLAAGALAAVSAFEPGDWTRVRLRLWPDLRADRVHDGRQAYRVGHLSQSAAR